MKQNPIVLMIELTIHFQEISEKFNSNILPHNQEEQPGCKLIPKRRSFIQAFDFKIILKKQEIIMISTPTQNY